jgi:hypothetical protein
MRFPSLALSERYDGDGRRLAFQIRPSAKRVMREALKRDAAQRRAAIARARLIEKAEADGCSVTLHVNPIERAALVKRLRKLEMTDDEVDDLVRIVDAYLSGRLCAADWRLRGCRELICACLSADDGRLTICSTRFSGPYWTRNRSFRMAAIGGRAAVV